MDIKIGKHTYGVEDLKQKLDELQTKVKGHKESEVVNFSILGGRKICLGGVGKEDEMFKYNEILDALQAAVNAESKTDHGISNPENQDIRQILNVLKELKDTGHETGPFISIKQFFKNIFLRNIPNLNRDEKINNIERILVESDKKEQERLRKIHERAKRPITDFIEKGDTSGIKFNLGQATIPKNVLWNWVRDVNYEIEKELGAPKYQEEATQRLIKAVPRFERNIPLDVKSDTIEDEEKKKKTIQNLSNLVKFIRGLSEELRTNYLNFLTENSSSEKRSIVPIPLSEAVLLYQLGNEDQKGRAIQLVRDDLMEIFVKWFVPHDQLGAVIKACRLEEIKELAKITQEKILEEKRSERELELDSRIPVKNVKVFSESKITNPLKTENPTARPFVEASSYIEKLYQIYNKMEPQERKEHFGDLQMKSVMLTLENGKEEQAVLISIDNEKTWQFHS